MREGRSYNYFILTCASKQAKFLLFCLLFVYSHHFKGRFCIFIVLTAELSFALYPCELFYIVFVMYFFSICLPFSRPSRDHPVRHGRLCIVSACSFFALLVPFLHSPCTPFFVLPQNCGLAILHKNCFLPRSAFSSSNLSVAIHWYR